MVSTVAADVCCKLVETRTASLALGRATAASGVDESLLKDACRTLQQQHCHYDPLDADRPVTTSAAMLLARGFSVIDDKQQQLKLAAAFVKACGRTAFAGCHMDDAHDVLTVRSGPLTLRPAAVVVKKEAVITACPSLTSVANRSSVIGLLDSTVNRATSLVEAGAYLHW